MTLIQEWSNATTMLAMEFWALRRPDAVIPKEVSENANDAIENDEEWNESDLYQWGLLSKLATDLWKFT